MCIGLERSGKQCMKSLSLISVLAWSSFPATEQVSFDKGKGKREKGMDEEAEVPRIAQGYTTHKWRGCFPTQTFCLLFWCPCL